jgi:hypothetical protein
MVAIPEEGVCEHIRDVLDVSLKRYVFSAIYITFTLENP